MTAKMRVLPARSTLHVQSPAFENDGVIPERYAAAGQNYSPPLSWSAGPLGTVSYALIVDDPDAPLGRWVHWTAWNLTTNRLDEDAAAIGRLPTGAVSGRNSWGSIGYGGPQPPFGTHRYVFRVYALDTKLDVGRHAERPELDRAMRGHQLASGELVGRYSKK
jgi:Raf kinase inhibitor-like YbhB/YbcL family protein